ncbi:MAG TPA: hypothetical protein PK395_09540 [bacterium]|mgnify:FL=1|nr:hypothetical protein [bacterium]
MAETAFLFHSGKAFPRLKALGEKRNHSFFFRKLAAIENLLELRRNPRSQEYMIDLVRGTYGECPPDQLFVIENPRHLPEIHWDTVEEIVLLWPDANGTSWTPLERKILHLKSELTKVVVLNGRRRWFVLNRMTWYGFRLRRLLEKTFICELGFLAVFLCVSPVLVLTDLLRRRR